MLYHLLYPLSEQFSVFNIFRYITFRTAYAVITAMFIAFVIGPWIIKKLRKRQVTEAIKKEGPTTHRSKEGDTYDGRNNNYFSRGGAHSLVGGFEQPLHPAGSASHGLDGGIGIFG
jgi:hypothetical protein